MSSGSNFCCNSGEGYHKNSAYVSGGGTFTANRVWLSPLPGLATKAIQALPYATGATGATGAAGDDGVAATIAVGTVTTGAVGSNATVTNISQVLLHF